MWIALIAACLLGVLATAPSAGAIGLQSVGSFSQPLFVTSPPGDPRLFVVERSGTIQVLHDGTQSTFLNITSLVRNTGEQGMLSMAFDPNFASNGLFYVFFTDNGTAGAPNVGDNHVDEFRVTTDPNAVDPATRRPVLTIVRGNSTVTNHNGGQLQFGKDGLLYISVGDNATSSNAQTTANLHGKVLRIDPHGATAGAYTNPPTNPFVGVPGAAPEIWSLGLRNPFRFSFDHLTGDLVIGDVGASQFEEIDFAPTAAGLGRGTNYGWPNCEGFSGTCPGATPPVFDYPHSDPGGDAAFGCAIIGGYVYRGTQIPEISGRYLYADLCTGELRSIQLGLPLAAGDRAESATGEVSPNSFGEDSNCELYVTDGNTVDKIVGSSPATVSPACQQQLPATPVTKKKCKRHKHKKHHASTAKKHKKKHCKKRKKKTKN